MPILAATPAMATLHLYIHDESSRNCQNSNFRVAISESIQREAKFCIFFRGTSPNHRFAKGRRTQIDAPQHHPQSGPKLAVLHEIHEFLQNLTKKLTRRRAQKNKNCNFRYPSSTLHIFHKMHKNMIKIKADHI